MVIKDYPLIKYILFFILGIASQNYYSLSFEFTLISISTIVVLSFIIHSVKNISKIINSIFLLIVVFISGNFYSGFRENRNIDYPFKSTKISNAKIYGVIEDIALLHGQKFSMVVRSDSIIANDTLIKIRRKFQCNVTAKNKKALNRYFSSIQIGDRIALNGLLRKGRGERNPGEFNYYKYLKSKGVSGVFYISNLSKARIIKGSKNYFENYVFTIRKWISNKIDIYHNKQTASLLKGLLLADRKEIDFETKENFINSGVIHVLAVSGLHVGFIVLIFMFLFSRLSIYLRTFLTIFGLIAFLILTNMPASVFRATIMVVVMFLIYLSNREYNSINALAIAALVLLLSNPHELFTPGFQLSFSAVFSILVLYPKISKRVTTQNKFLRYLLLFFAVSFSAQIGTLPFTLIYFHKLSIIALLTNLFVIPIIGVILGLGVLTIFVSAFAPILAHYYASSNMLVTEILMNIVKFAGEQKYAFLFIPNFSIYDGMIFYIFIILLIYVIENFKNKKALFIFTIIAIIDLGLFIQLDNKDLLPDGKFSIMLIDIGQGDAILLKFPNGKTALIDAGNATLTFDNGERVIAPLLRKVGIDKIDYGFITHVDGDHYKGFLYLIRNKIIRKIYKPRIDTTLRKDVFLEKEIVENQIPLKYYSKSLMDIGNLRLYILNDTTNVNYKKLDMNNRSGIIKILYGENSFLFTGDAEKPAEKLLINEYGNFLVSDVLKLGHHGSKTSSSFPFIKKVNPQIGLISVGENNKFGHPSKGVLERLLLNGTKIFRTDKEGALLFCSDGDKIKKVNWKEF